MADWANGFGVDVDTWQVVGDAAAARSTEAENVRGASAQGASGQAGSLRRTRLRLRFSAQCVCRLSTPALADHLNVSGSCQGL